MKGYKNYKYQSYYLDLMNKDKKTQKLLPYHLQTTTKTPRKRYELNAETKVELLHHSKLDNIFTDNIENEYQRSTAITVSGSQIQTNYNKVILSFMHDSMMSKRDSSSERYRPEQELNNSIIDIILTKKKHLSVNPRIINNQKKINYREMNTIKEFKILVKNTQQYLELSGKKSNMKVPYIFQFILRDVYLSFKELPQLIQDRILLAFNINPYLDEEIVYYEQFSKFKQIVISKEPQRNRSYQFFCQCKRNKYNQFFNPERKLSISVGDVRALLALILENIEDVEQLLKYFMNNLALSIYVKDDQIKDLKAIFQSKVIDPNQLIELLLNNI
ncbi:hypothetical protein pb186bvf_000551 [Paramecium bursaria]